MSALEEKTLPAATTIGNVGVPPGADRSVAETVQPLVESVLGPVPVRIELWDGSSIGPADSTDVLHVRSADAVRRMLWAPGELGVARAFVLGELDAEGDLFAMIRTLRPAGVQLRTTVKAAAPAVRAVRSLGISPSPLPPPAEEARPHGSRHSKRRDAEAISHHYDVGNDFYALVLGDSMTYSCARFVEPSDTLEAAQAAKHELVCRKLGLHEQPGARLLDVGCGWGSMAMHAAREHGARVVGITISREQADLASRRVSEAGLDEHVEIRLQDYRDLGGETFDAISSIGMFEHVGTKRIADYFTTLRTVLKPTGRLLNHAISSVGGSKIGKRTFIYRYVFPDGELIDVGDVALAMEAAGFEVRDVESLREHYDQTLRRWVANLQDNWDAAVDLVGSVRARVWLLYMAASAIGFEDGGISIHQVLAVSPDDAGASKMPSTRRGWS